MSIPQYKDKKPAETNYAYDTKVVYCKKKLQDVYNELTVTYFAENFEQMLKDVEFEWKHYTKGKPRYPSLKQILNHWFNQHKWEECSQNYVDEMTAHDKKKARQVYDKKYLKDTITDFKTIDRLRARHKTLEDLEKIDPTLDNTYKKAKIEEEINSIWTRIRTRLTLDQETEPEEEIIPIDPNPYFEDQEHRDHIYDILWGMVEKR